MAEGRIATSGLMLGLFAAGYLAGGVRGASPLPAAEASHPAAQEARVYELRTYTAAEGKLEDLLARFRDHTLRIFERHGMTSVGYWLPQDDPLAQNTLVYLLAHPSRQAADEAWRAFGADPEWQRVAEASQQNGRLIAGLQRMYLDPADFSPMR